MNFISDYNNKNFIQPETAHFDEEKFIKLLDDLPSLIIEMDSISPE